MSYILEDDNISEDNNILECCIIDKVIVCGEECINFECVNKNLYICINIYNYSNNNNLILMGSNDNINFFDYKYIKYNDNNEKVFKIKNIFEYYKIINRGGPIQAKILIFSK